MGGADRLTAADLKSRLVAEGQGFAFFQAVRLLRLALRAEHDAEPLSRLRIRPDLSLSFPEADIDTIEPLPDGQGYRITANFLGLYGVSSPLPTFYTEDLIDEAQHDQHAGRGFLDVLHYAIYPLFFDAWRKYRQMMTYVEDRDEAARSRWLALIGFADQTVQREIPQADMLLRYAGLLSQYPRSALGLQTMLADALDGAAVRVGAGCSAQLAIPEDQRLALGGEQAVLGELAVLGQQVEDRSASVQIRIGPVDEAQFRALLPLEPLHNRIRTLVRLYVIDPMLSSVELVLARGQVQPACLGGSSWARLGLDTWSFAGRYEEEVRVPFALYR